MQTRIIYIDEQPIEVSEEVYRAFKRPAWAERKRRIVRRKHEISLEVYGGKIVAPDFEDRLLDSLALKDALSSLAPTERDLIDALFYAGMTEREYASQIGISQKNVNTRKQRILDKLRAFLAA